MSKYTPRRAYDEENLPGYLESDRCYIKNNEELCVEFLDNYENNTNLVQLCKNFIEKHRITSETDERDTWIKCGGFNEADSINLICEIFKIVQEMEKKND